MPPSSTPTPLESPISRRGLLTGAAAGAVLATLPHTSASAAGVGTFGGDPFTLGIASGDPDATSVVLWTRLALKPLDPDFGMQPRKFPVHWQVAHDERFEQIVQEGTTFALPENNHSVHVIPQGLEPDRWYFYRFRAGSELSPVGRTRTLPAPGAPTNSFTVVHASCQNWREGLYTAWREIANDSVDLVLFLGDYIYEGNIGAPSSYLPRAPLVLPDHARAACLELENYRYRYTFYKMDADLQAAHASVPFVPIWDDHEVVNDFKGPVETGSRLKRAAGAYRAWWENMPTRLPRPSGTSMKIYRRLEVGDLMQIDMLDSRQYRTADNDPVVSRLGNEQEAWLIDGIRPNGPRWNVLAQGQQLGNIPQASPTRNRIYGAYYERGVQPVILSGDMHWTVVLDALLDVPNADSPIVGTEFIGTSITSTGDGPGNPATKRNWLKNPWVKYVDGLRGYIKTEYTHTGVTAVQHDVEFVSRPGGRGFDAQKFFIEPGRAGVQLL
ncbi:alkaline phosphatase D family protein [Kribbia dieselivorans]|uniref:alkaline phosphatase D family protein n=1 Tax=Kribbia dieselivorans TaxID=331526 RepID=UPI0008390B4B|nr:alkaline phosphatase D family protein [Kribbia dieselivorans]